MARENEALLQFLYLSPVGIAQIDLAGNVEMMNPLALQLLLPIAPGGMLTNLLDAMSTVAPELHHMVEAFAEEQGPICENYRVQLVTEAQGRKRPEPIVVALTLLKLDAGQIMAVIVDISKQVAQERQIREHEAWLAAIFNAVNDYALCTTDQFGIIDSWNASGERLTGLLPEDVLGQPYLALRSRDDSGMAQALDIARHDGWHLDEGWCRRKDGAEFWSSCLVSAMKLEDGEVCGFSVVIRDTTARKTSLDELRRITTTDALTGLCNRYNFFERAEALATRRRRLGTPLTAIMLDLDHFKRINDTFGHFAGDQVLRSLGPLCRRELRGADLVGRLGGEEFAILLPATDRAQAIAVAERLRLEIENTEIALEGVTEPVRFTASLGVAVMASGEDTISALLKRADAALYAAKHGGRNRVETGAEDVAARPEAA